MLGGPPAVAGFFFLASFHAPHALLAFAKNALHRVHFSPFMFWAATRQCARVDDREQERDANQEVKESRGWSGVSGYCSLVDSLNFYSES